MAQTNKQKLINDLRLRGFTDLATRAETGEFSDFASKHTFPMIQLVKELKRLNGAADLVENAKNGVYDHDE